MYLESCAERNIYVINFTAYRYLSEKHWVFNVGTGCLIVKVFKRSVLRLLLGILSAANYRKLRLMAPHLVNEFTNYIAFNFRDVVYQVVYDGVFNITGTDQRQKARIFAIPNKRARWFLMPYVRYAGRMTGADVLHVDKYYMPKLLAGNNNFLGENVCYFDFADNPAWSDSCLDMDAAIYLDQPLDLSEGEIHECQRLLLGMVDKHGCRLIIKRHPSKKHLSRVVLGLVDHLTYEVCTDNEPLEMMIGRLRPRFVWSITSTGVINARAMSDKIECAFIGLSLLAKERPALNKLAPLAEELGIILVDDI